jgi:4-aminobutyrate aminotransferase-like enzyme
VIGIVDFGDMVIAPVVCDPAIAAAYLAFGRDDPGSAIAELLVGYHAVWPLGADEVALVPDLVAGRLAQSLLVAAWRVELHPENAAYILSDVDDSFETLGRLGELAPGALAQRLLDVCALSGPTVLPTDEALARRRGSLGASLSLTYTRPVHLVGGDGVWLEDAGGNRLLDAYNNVPHVGHGHPRVTAALAAQARRLTTNTRYLVDDVSLYAERLTRLLPEELSVVLFVNSGSEANDVAYQIARAVTGAEGVLITDHAYHGTTAVTAAFSPEEHSGHALDPWVATVGGEELLGAPDATNQVGAGVDAAVARLGEAGHRPALAIFDGVFSSDGIFSLPPGFLGAVYDRARAVGAVCVADEVQAGFGRVGRPFWGFAQDDVVPDLVTLGKPMGNGHPMGAVITTEALAEAFATRWHFFSTFAGSPVAARVGAAVLDVIEDEGLTERAEVVGEQLRAGLRALALGNHEIRAVRGPGLFVGVELVDAEVAREVVDALRVRGILVGRTGPRGNVIKIRPPLTFTERHADHLVATLATILDTRREAR